MYIFVAWGINEIKNKFLKDLVIILIIIFSLINLVLEKKYYHSPNKAQFREASNIVIENNTRKHEVYTSQKYWFDYYFNKSEQNPVVEKEFETLINEMINDSSKIQSFWYLDAFGKVYQPSEKSLEFLNKNFVIDESFDGFQGWAKHFVLTKETPQFINLTGLDMKSTYSGDSFMNNIEIFDIKDNLLSVSGWAYFNNISSEGTKVYLVLINNSTQIDRVKLIPIQSMNSKDILSYLIFGTKFSNSSMNEQNKEAQASLFILNELSKDYVKELGIDILHFDYDPKTQYIETTVGKKIGEKNQIMLKNKATNGELIFLRELTKLWNLQLGLMEKTQSIDLIYKKRY
jgi:hypothetical protein